MDETALAKEEKPSSSSEDMQKMEEPQMQEASQTPVATQKKSFHFKLTVFMLCSISVVVAMDSVIVAASLPATTVALKGTTLEAFWVGTSYLLAQTASGPSSMPTRSQPLM